MSAVSPVPPSGNGLDPRAGGMVGLRQNDFLKLMVAQLENQNPLNPVSTDTFLQEMASFTEVVDIQQMLETEEMGAAISLLGRTVTATDPATGAKIQGTVQKVTLQGNQPMVSVGSSEIPLGAVTAVS